MQYIDDELLTALFAQSALDLPKDKREAWQKELNYWVHFFNMDQFEWKEQPDTTQARVMSLRPDVPEKGLELSAVKSVSTRFVDGFIALPKGSQKEGARDLHE